MAFAAKESGRYRLNCGWLAALLLSLSLPLAADSWREQVVADDVAPGLTEGELIWLTEPGDAERFWVVARDTWRKESKGAAVIVADSHANPASKALLEPLTQTLREAGWTTLVLQPPDEENPVYFNQAKRQARARLEAAIAYELDKKHDNIALLGAGDGALTALDYAANHPIPANKPLSPGVKILALLDMPMQSPGEEKAQPLDWLTGLAIPVADFFRVNESGGEDAWASQRKIAAKANEDYRQVRFVNADPAAWAESNLLVKRLSGWLGNAMEDQLAKLEEQEQELAEKREAAKARGEPLEEDEIPAPPLAVTQETKSPAPPAQGLPAALAPPPTTVKEAAPASPASGAAIPSSSAPDVKAAPSKSAAAAPPAAPAAVSPPVAAPVSSGSAPTTPASAKKPALGSIPP